MASNGLIANPKKTAMLFLNTRIPKNSTAITIKMGKDTVEQVHSAKLLGMTFNDKQNWNDHIHGKGGVINSLNQKIFLILRLRNFLNTKSLVKIADSIFTSKIRYGVQLLGKVRLIESDPTNQDLKAIQVVQNKLARILNGVKLTDRICANILLAKLKMLSVNQINAQAKLLDMWKAIHVEGNPLQITKRTKNQDSMSTRSDNNLVLTEKSSTALGKKTFLNDATNVWNAAPNNLKHSCTISAAKKAIKLYVSMLPM